MSVASVQQVINQSKQVSEWYESPVIDADEARAIVAEAEAGRLTEGEGELLGNLYRNGISTDYQTRAAPELSGDEYYLEEGAAEVLNDFFFAHDLPYGNNDGSVTTTMMETPDDPMHERLPGGPSHPFPPA
jgi:hypothetical protein